VEIILHAHHAPVSDAMKSRAHRIIAKLAARLKRTVDAVIRFEGDGAEKRVELVLHTAKRRDLVAEGRGKHFGPAFAQALAKLEAQVRAEHTKLVRQRREVRRESAA
jgi:ribosome-associated translation inhibitor RaiA